jgi:BlaI family transcriptional regulator, penicillinase repressor
VHQRLTHGLSKRERQIIEAIYSMTKASVAEVRSAIPDPPSYSAVRAMMNILVRKGILSFSKEGRKYLYFPLVRRGKARQFAMKRVLEIYFDNSVHEAVSGIIQADRGKLTDQDYAELIELIKRERKRETEK